MTRSNSWETLPSNIEIPMPMRSAALRDTIPVGIRNSPGCSSLIIASACDRLPMRTSESPKGLATLNVLSSIGRRKLASISSTFLTQLSASYRQMSRDR